MNARSSWTKPAAAVFVYAWLFGGLAYYLVRFSRSFYIENEYQIRKLAAAIFGS
jgi:hypothetical protein